MANICSFSMKAKGKSENITAFYNAMTQNGTIYMGRGAEAEINYDDAEGSAQIDGWCKWSVQSAMIDDAISMRTNPNIWSWGGGVDTSKLEFITLLEATEKWNLVIEAYSEESGCCFQEHYIFDKGTVVSDECVDWEEYWLDGYKSKEEAEEELEIIISDVEWADRYYSRGGFESWDFEI